MVIKYTFVLHGEIFECNTFEYLVNLHNYHDIKLIHCSYNSLTVLPTLPHSLRHLYCSNNLLKVLPTLPNSLRHLYCHHNKIILLPTLPNSLQKLYCCYNNNLTLLPTLPNSLEVFNCYSNLLLFLPIFPKSLTNKKYRNNPVFTYIKENCANNLAIYHRINEIFSNKLVGWYLDCRENPTFKFCRTRLNKEYDALMEEDVDGGIMG